MGVEVCLKYNLRSEAQESGVGGGDNSSPFARILPWAVETCCFLLRCPPGLGPALTALSCLSPDVFLLPCSWEVPTSLFTIFVWVCLAPSPQTPFLPGMHWDSRRLDSHQTCGV